MSAIAPSPTATEATRCTCVLPGQFCPRPLPKLRGAPLSCRGSRRLGAQRLTNDVAISRGHPPRLFAKAPPATRGAPRRPCELDDPLG
eukprot:4990261-Alexandrium_andersonii.AAC.1